MRSDSYSSCGKRVRVTSGRSRRAVQKGWELVGRMPLEESEWRRRQREWLERSGRHGHSRMGTRVAGEGRGRTGQEPAPEGKTGRRPWAGRRDNGNVGSHDAEGMHRPGTDPPTTVGAGHTSHA